MRHHLDYIRTRENFLGCLQVFPNELTNPSFLNRYIADLLSSSLHIVDDFNIPAYDIMPTKITTIERSRDYLLNEHRTVFALTRP